MYSVENVPHIEAISTTYNRKKVSLISFSALFKQFGNSQDFTLHATVVDDASSDGTLEALEDAFKGDIKCISGSGDLYWSRGMSVAENQVLLENTDFILWFNDDVLLDEKSLLNLLKISIANPGAIIIGAMRDSHGHTSYSGLARRGKRPGNLSLVQPSASLQEIDTFHGNLVLVPSQTAKQLGGIDPTYQHAYGDIDYGLRAKSLGIPILLAPNTYGICEPNELDIAWRDPMHSRSKRLKMLFGIKGYPFHSHVHFNRRHGGYLWPLFVVASYAKNLGLILLSPNKSN